MKEVVNKIVPVKVGDKPMSNHNKVYFQICFVDPIQRWWWQTQGWYSRAQGKIK